MPSIKEIFRVLRAVTDPVVDTAMAEALPTADPDARRLIVFSLLERRQKRALVELVQHYHLLDHELQQTLLQYTDRLDGALRGAARHSAEQARLNAIEIIRRSLGFRFAYLLSELLRREEPRVTREAAQALLELTEAAYHRPIESDPNGRPGEARTWRLRWLNSALTEAAGSYHQHGRRDALLAATLLVPRGSERLLKSLTDRRSDAHRALQALIRRAECPQIHRTLLCLAGIDALKPAAVEAMEHSDLRRRTGPLLWQSHLLVVPSVWQTVRRARRATCLLPGNDALRECGVGGWRRLPRWLRPLRIENAPRLETLGRVTAQDDPLTRLIGLRALMEMHNEQADQLIADLALDARPRIARIALRHLEQRRSPMLRKLAARLVNAEDPVLRRLAERHLAPVGFDRLWENWDRLQPAMRRTAARALMKIDPHFRHHLAGHLESETPSQRRRAIAMVRQLGQQGEFEAELLRRLEDMSESVAADAADALGAGGETPRTVAGLLRVLQPDLSDRVAVSVIGALRRLGRLEDARPRLRKLADASAGKLHDAAVNALQDLGEHAARNNESTPNTGKPTAGRGGAPPKAAESPKPH